MPTFSVHALVAKGKTTLLLLCLLLSNCLPKSASTCQRQARGTRSSQTWAAAYTAGMMSQTSLLTTPCNLAHRASVERDAQPSMHTDLSAAIRAATHKHSWVLQALYCK